MKIRIQKAICLVLTLSLLAAFAACGKNGAEPADSLTVNESYTQATEPRMEDSEIDKIIHKVLGDTKWEGDYSALTEEQRTDIQTELRKKGYEAIVTEKGITFFEYTPTADEEEISEVVEKVLGEEKEWDGNYGSLSDKEKEAVKDVLVDRGYDVEVGQDDFVFKNEADRKEETTSLHYNKLPTKEQIYAAVYDAIGQDAWRNWDEDIMSLSKEKRDAVVGELNDYGFHVAINEKGEFYIIHDPSKKTSVEKADTDVTVNSTITATTAATTQSGDKTETTTKNNTGTTATKELAAPEVARKTLSTFGGTSGDLFVDVASTKDGGYVTAARYQSLTGDFADTDPSWRQIKSAVVKYDKNGSVEWKSLIGGNGTAIGVWFDAVTVLKDGSIIAVGQTDSKNLGEKFSGVIDGVIVKFSKNGTREWVKLYGGSKGEMFYSVAATPDGGFVVGGKSESSDNYFSELREGTISAVLIKMNADGEKEWIKSIDGSKHSSFDEIAVTDEGYIYAVCNTRASDLDYAEYAGYGKGDAIVFKYSPEGGTVTHKTIYGSGLDEIGAITLGKDGGVVVTGHFGANTHTGTVFDGKHNFGESDVFVIKLDARLQVEWVNTFGGIGVEQSNGITSIDGGYAITGFSTSTNNDFSFLGGGNSDVFVITLSENGTSCEKYSVKGPNSEQCFGMATANGKKFAIVGATQSPTGSFAGLTPSAAKDKYLAFFALFEVK